MEIVTNDWLRDKRKERGLSLLEVAQALGKASPGSAADLESGRRKITGEMLGALATLFGYEVEDLALVEGGELRVPPAARNRIPVYAIVAAGPETDAVTQGDTPIDHEPATSPSDGLYALEVGGESMEPLLQNGDRVVVDPREHAGDCDIVVAVKRESGEKTLKFYVRRPDGFFLVPLNPASKFKPTRYDARYWHVEGVIVKIILRHARGRFCWLIQMMDPDRT